MFHNSFTENQIRERKPMSQIKQEIRRKQKGAYGFLSYQKKKTLLLTIFFFGLVIAIFVTGFVTTKSRMNVLTVVAILGCLPACKQAVNCFMVFRKKPCSEERYHRILESSGSVLTAYELYITSPKTAYAFDAACVRGRDVILLTHPGKMNTKECQDFLKEILKNNEKSNCNVRIYEEEKRFCERLKQLSEKPEENVEESDFILRVLLAISV